MNSAQKCQQKKVDIPTSLINNDANHYGQNFQISSKYFEENTKFVPQILLFTTSDQTITFIGVSNTVFQRIVSEETILFWKWKMWKLSYSFRIMANFLLHKLNIVYPRIVSALEQFPPLNSFRTFMYCDPYVLWPKVTVHKAKFKKE